jgi:dihydropteroate synthase
VSIDTHKAEVMRVVLAEGADMINDITALASPDSVAALAGQAAPVVLMFSRSRGARADRIARPHQGLIEEILDFFRARAGGAGAAGDRPDAGGGRSRHGIFLWAPTPSPACGC